MHQVLLLVFLFNKLLCGFSRGAQSWDPRVVCSRLTKGTVLCPWARQFILCLVLVQPRKTEKCPDMCEKLFMLTGTNKQCWFSMKTIFVVLIEHSVPKSTHITYGLRREKTSLRGLRTTQAQTSLRMRQLISPFVVRLLERIISKLASSKFYIF